MKQNLIIGLAADYQWHQLKTFVYSLRNTTFQGDVVLFVTRDVDVDTLEHLQKAGVGYVYIDRQEFATGDFRTEWPVTLIRVPIYLRYLLEHGHHYSRVLMTDTRDVVFQRDPFSFDSSASINFFQEPRTTLIRDEDWNSLWLISAVGASAYHTLCHYPITCFGTILGRCDTVIEYLQRVKQQAARISVMIWGIEQGIHNYIVRNNLIDKATIHTSEEGPAFTIGAGYDDTFTQNGEGAFLNRQGDVIYFIHQYDRHPQLKSYFENKYKKILSLTNR